MKSSESGNSSVERSCELRICGGEDCFLASIDRSIAFGAFRLDGELRVVCAHGALTRRVPVSADTYIGKRIGDLDEALTPRMKDLERWLLDVVSSRKGVFFEKRLPDYLGNSSCVGLVLPVQHEGGDAPDLLCVLFDISNCESVRAIRNEVASELAFLAHELRNPLATISSGLKILEMHPSPEAAEHARQMMGRQVRHATNIIRDVFDLARIRDGRFPVEIRGTGVGEVVDLALEISGESIKRGAHTLTVHIDEDLPRIYVDKNKLAQALSNILDNASKYTPNGGTISLDVVRDGEHLILRVSDTGLGIGSDKLRRIFELFGQVEEHRSYSRGGLGIGLFLVKAIVQGHGGVVLVHSDGEGKGSCFTLRLPLTSVGTPTSPG